MEIPHEAIQQAVAQHLAAAAIKLDPPMTKRERLYVRRFQAAVSSAATLMQVLDDPGIGSMGTELELIISENMVRLVQAYRDAKGE